MGTVVVKYVRRRATLALAVLGASALIAMWSINAFGGYAAEASDSATIPESARSFIVDGAAAPQQAALADMSVSRPEYVAAVEAVRKCMADAGVVTSEPVWAGNQLHFEFGGTPDRAGLAPMKAVYKDCNDRYLVGVATAWGIGSSPAR